MKGTLIKTEQGWRVKYIWKSNDLFEPTYKHIPLHPSDQINDEILLKDGEYVDFEKVDLSVSVDGSIKMEFAKLIIYDESHRDNTREYKNRLSDYRVDGLDDSTEYKKVQDDVEKLAEQEFPYLIDSNVDNHQNHHTNTLRHGFKKGYNKAKETLYTDEQLMEAMLQISKYYADNLGKDLNGHKKALEIIQSLKQPKK